MNTPSPTTISAELKLSAAIRLGAAKRPQAFNCPFFAYVGFPYLNLTLASCVEGAAMEGYGANPDRPEDLNAPHYITLPQFRAANDLPCPACAKPGSGWRHDENTLPHLNDVHRWSREAIADWLEAQGL